MDEERVQVDIIGLTTSPASGGAYALLLKEIDGERQLPIIIGQFEAQSIALEMEGIKPPRPLTHDLIKNIIDALGLEVTDVVINDLREGTFYATITVDGQQIDSRPSDAIALAVRCGIPIYVSEKVMQEAAFLPEPEEEEGESFRPSSRQVDDKESKLEFLRKQLKEAVEREDYETAARIRDAIRKIELSDH
ncbi:MAG: hypothetical protein IGBAC_1519 [Ignavibacteriae bacterium]|nr:MAG: hypothetical protein IGBAC_1519 [Ignavibacteriota bacterium]